MQRSVMLEPIVDDRGLVRVGGIVIGALTDRGTIEIKDNNRMRVQCRGSIYVEFTVESLAALINQPQENPG